MTWEYRLVTPKTAHVAPIDAEQLRWAAQCYECRHIAAGGSRTQAIREHAKHRRADHGERPKAAQEATGDDE